MKHLIGQILKTLRRERKVTQAVLAGALGVCQQLVSQWETGERPFPPQHVDQACTVLGVGRERLCPPPRPAAIRVLLGTRRSKRLKYRPTYEIGALIEHMTTLGRFQHEMHARVRRRLSPCEYDEVARRFPRDTAHELTFVFHALDCQAEVARTTLGRFRLPLSALHDELWTDGNDLLQPSLLWERGDERLVIFGQPWLNLPWHDPVRPDFLVYYRRKGEPGYWLYVEIDDNGHREKEARDQARDLAIGLVGLRYENPVLANPGFFDRFLRDVRNLRARVDERRRERRRRARALAAKRRREAEARRSRS